MTKTDVQRIGLIAGAGDVPLYLARKAHENGIQVISVSLTDAIGENLKPFVEKNYSIGVGQAGKIRKTLEKEQAFDVLILGKVEKNMIFKLQMFDLETLKILKSFKNNQDQSVMDWLVSEADKRGFTLLDQMEFMPELFPEKGTLTKTEPSEKIMEDVRFGLPIAKSMADQEIGQTLVVKNQSVIAVEAVEGTDKTIQRGCELSNGKCTVVKVSRTQQDYRFDTPGIGPFTIERMIEGKASALAIEAGRVMIVNREQVVKMANKAGLAIVCV